MTAKEFLKQYEYAQQRADRCRVQYETELEKIDAIGSTLSGDGQPHGSGISRKTEEKAIRLADKAMAWRMAELDALEIRERVFSLIWNIPDIEGELLFERYINLMTWEAIAEKLHYSVRGIHAAHSRALKIVAKRMNQGVH